MPEALPAPVFTEALIGEEPVAATRCGEHPAIIIDLPRGKQVSSRTAPLAKLTGPPLIVLLTPSKGRRWQNDSPRSWPLALVRVTP